MARTATLHVVLSAAAQASFSLHACTYLPAMLAVDGLQVLKRQICICSSSSIALAHVLWLGALGACAARCAQSRLLHMLTCHAC